MIWNGTTFSIVLLSFPICICMCARVNTLQVESRWPKMKCSNWRWARKRDLCLYLFYGSTTSREVQKHFICSCDIATYFIRRWKERKRNLIFWQRPSHRKNSYFLLFSDLKEFQWKKFCSYCYVTRIHYLFLKKGDERWI